GNLNGDQPLVCDWDGDGRDEPVIYRSGTWYLRSGVVPGGTARRITFGTAGDLAVCGDLDGDGRDELMIGSPWGIGMIKLSGSTMTAPAMAPNGTRFGGWLLNSFDNRIWAAADLDGDGRDELLITSPWGIGVLELARGSFTSVMLAPNGTRFGGWLLNTADNQFRNFQDVTGGGRANLMVESPWGIGIFTLNGATFNVPMMAPNGTRFGGWLLNTHDNQF
ncbi:MAG: hypothetical protein ACXWUX_03325, partial [Allosphingosinicella sp.]